MENEWCGDASRRTIHDRSFVGLSRVSVMTEEDPKVVSINDCRPRTRGKKLPLQAELNCPVIRDLATKAVIYPNSITPKEAQELGSAVLFHLKKYYGYIDPS